MAEIAAALVKELRDQTGAPMMDCKRALQETNGDMEGAVRVLRGGRDLHWRRIGPRLCRPFRQDGRDIFCRLGRQ